MEGCNDRRVSINLKNAVWDVALEEISTQNGSPKEN